MRLEPMKFRNKLPFQQSATTAGRPLLDGPRVPGRLKPKALSTRLKSLAWRNEMLRSRHPLIPNSIEMILTGQKMGARLHTKSYSVTGGFCLNSPAWT
jgi:hypothetical protein